MKSLKFRVWDKKYNVWSVDVIFIYSTEEVLLKNRILQQFTGLKDKYGQEIYEGDIMEFVDDVGVRCRGVVNYDHNYAAFLIDNSALWKEYMSNQSVIGNILENPELLE